MADQIKILRPNGTLFITSPILVVGAANAHTALNDNSDASYVTLQLSQVSWGDLDTFQFAPGALIKAIFPVARMGAHSGSELPAYGYIAAFLPDGRQPGAAPLLVSYTTAPQTFGGLVSTSHPDNRPWTQADIDTLQWVISAAGVAYFMRYYEFYMYVYYNRRPFVVANSPASGLVIVDKTQPTFVWGYGDWEGEVEEAYHLKVFSGNAVVANPETEVARLIYDSGVVVGGVTSLKIPSSLANGQYRWAVKASDQGSNQRWGAGNQLTFNEYSFETSVADWTATNATMSRDAAKGLAGIASMKLVSTAAADITVRLNRFIDIDALEPAEFAAYFFPNTTLRTVQVGIEWYNAASGLISTSTLSAAQVASQWNLDEFWATAPALAVKIKPIIKILATAIGEIFWVDAVTLMLGTAAKRYWSTETFEINVPPPALPVMTVTVDNTNQRVQVGVVAGAGVSTDWFEVQRSVDGGVTWEYLRGGMRMLAVQSPLFDREGPRGKPVSYRAKAWRYLAVDQIEVSTSAWTAVQTVTVVSDGKMWFRHPTNAALDMVLRTSYDKGEHLSSNSTEEMTSFAPSERSEYVVVGSVPQGEIFDTIPLLFLSDAEWAKFEALRKSGQPVLWQTYYGGANGLEQFWIKLGPDRSRVFINKPNVVSQVRAIDWTPTAITNLTGLVEYSVGVDGMVRWRGVVTPTANPTGYLCYVTVPVGASPVAAALPLYFDYEGGGKGIVHLVSGAFYVGVVGGAIGVPIDISPYAYQGSLPAPTVTSGGNIGLGPNTDQVRKVTIGATQVKRPTVLS